MYGLLILKIAVDLSYRVTCRQCPPDELVPALEVAFGITFPEEGTEIRTAKSPCADSTTHFCIRMVVGTADIPAFYESFDEELAWDVFRNDDDPRMLAKKRVPAWCLSPITEGRTAIYSAGKDPCLVVEDTSSKEVSVVYLIGRY